MMLNKFIYSLLILLFYSCQSQENKEYKEMEILNNILNTSGYKNSEENFAIINKNNLGINTKNLQDGYSPIKIFNIDTDYSLSKQKRFIKIGIDILPDLDRIGKENITKLSHQPYYNNMVMLNKIIYSNDLYSSTVLPSTNIDLARDIVVLFNYENNENLLKNVCAKFENFDDLDTSDILATIFYNKDHEIRKKLLKNLTKNQDLIYHLTFYLADHKTKIINENKLSSKEIDKAVAFLLNLGLEGRTNEDIDTDHDLSYRLLNNIFISYPDFIITLEKNNYFDNEDLKYFIKLFQTKQEFLNDSSPVKVYYIYDPDGYTNLRKEKSTHADILQKINSGEHIEVLDDTGDWFLVKTKEGKTGYVHKSRVKSKEE